MPEEKIKAKPAVPCTGWHSVAPAFIVDFNDEEITAALNEIGDFKVEGREATNVLTNLLTVEINVCLIVGCSKVNKEAGVGPSLVVEGFLVPDGAFVKEQLL